MYLGIEIGGTKLQAGLVDDRGRLRRLSRVTVDRAAGRAGILRQLAVMIPPLLAAGKVTAIGIGFGGPVDVRTGRVVKSHQVAGWSGFDLRTWCRRAFGRPVFVENDSHCAGLAEAHCGAGRGRARVFYFNVGTGIGGAFVLDGAICQGRFGGGELGHTRLPRGGRWVTLESVAAGLAIERGTSTVTRSGQYVGAAVANAIALLNPEVVVVGGGVPRAGAAFWRPLRTTVRRLVFPPFRRNFRLVPAALGENVVVVGAGLVAKGRAGASAAARQQLRRDRRARARARARAGVGVGRNG